MRLRLQQQQDATAMYTRYNIAGISKYRRKSCAFIFQRVNMTQVGLALLGWRTPARQNNRDVYTRHKDCSSSSSSFAAQQRQRLPALRVRLRLLMLPLPTALLLLLLC